MKYFVCVCCKHKPILSTNKFWKYERKKDETKTATTALIGQALANLRKKKKLVNNVPH